jgi:hypothetical protein
MAIFLTIGCIEVLLGKMEIGPGLAGMLMSQMLVGTADGLLGGYAVVGVVNRIELGAAGMYPVLVSAFCLLIFGLTVQFGGSGFLAVYLAGVVVGNRRLMYQRSIRRFHDAIAWLAQIIMFVALGLLCFPSRLWEVRGKALLISVVLILVARPVAVWLSAWAFRFSWRELTFMSWVGLKGAVPITLATFPLMLGTPESPVAGVVVVRCGVFHRGGFGGDPGDQPDSRGPLAGPGAAARPRTAGDPRDQLAATGGWRGGGLRDREGLARRGSPGEGPGIAWRGGHRADCAWGSDHPSARDYPH